MKDKTRIVLAGIIAVLVILTSLLLAATQLSKGKTIDLVLPAGIIVLVILFMIPFVKKRYFDVKKGYPYEDERSKKIMQKVMSNAYIASLYWLLAIGWASDRLIEFRDVSQAMGLGITGMAVFFGIFYVYYSRKGDAE